VRPAAAYAGADGDGDDTADRGGPPPPDTTAAAVGATGSGTAGSSRSGHGGHRDAPDDVIRSPGHPSVVGIDTATCLPANENRSPLLIESSFDCCSNQTAGGTPQ